jgi:hypothetical protein
MEVNVEIGKETEIVSKQILAIDPAIKYSFMPSESLKAKNIASFRDNTLKVRAASSDLG